MASMRPASRPVDLLHLTDTHVMADPRDRLKGVDTRATLQRVAAHAGARSAPPDVVLVTGDIAGDDSAGAYLPFREALAPLGRPVYCIPGNHDDPALLRSSLPGEGFHVEPHVDLQGWRIVLLDSVLPGEVHGHLATAELERLDLALGHARAPFALVCLHHPPVALGSAWMDRIGLANAGEFWQVIDRHPSVRCVLWGHAHQVFDGMRGAARLLCSPSTCIQFRRGAQEPEHDDLPPGYRVLRLGGQGTVTSHVVWVGKEAGMASAAAMG